ncbi:MAG: hypothetical protein ACJ744_07685 [Gaiellaceae bacterium]
MSIYEWPADTERESGDDPLARQRFMAPRRLQFDLEGALLAGRTMAPRGPRRARELADGMGSAFGQATGTMNLWLPLGPTRLLDGQAANDPRVAGRVRALAVHPNGERIYAAAANGGIWYSSNSGESWRSIGGLAPTDRSGITRPAHRHACGAVLLKPDHDFPDDESKDVVFVGTGERTPGTFARPGQPLAGIGILAATGPASSTEDNPWVREAPNVAGHGVFRLAAQPNGSGVVAATSIGLLERPASPGEGINWEPVAGAPFHTFGGVVMDVLWTAAVGAAPERLWVWGTGDQGGLWVRDAPDPDFFFVATPGGINARSVLAASEPPTKVYVLNNRFNTTPKKLPALYRIANDSIDVPTATQVTDGVPDVLRDQGEYDITMAVDPGNADRVVIAGSWLVTKNPGGTPFESYNGSLVVAEVGMKASKLTFGYNAAPTAIGIGVHADVHDLHYAKGGARLWVSCDGGVFLSDHPTRQVGFIARNDGLQIAEANFIASHPTCEGLVVVGLQDNGVMERHSSSVWKVVMKGDGGGVTFDPTDTTRYLAQYIRATWLTSSGGGFNALLVRGGTPVPGTETGSDENNKSSFYSTPAAVKHTRGSGAAAHDVTQVVVGTDRVWYTEDWGLHWATLPGGTDPITPTTYDRGQNRLAQPVAVLKWAGPDVLWVLTQELWEDPGGQVLRLERTAGSADAGGPGSWADPTDVIVVQKKKEKKGGTGVEGKIHEATAWTDLAVNPGAAGAGPKGAVYLGTTGHPDKPQVDTLWWFDGTETWYPTHLRTDVPAAVTAVLCDPANPEHVYVGTTIGVWRGTRTVVGNNPPQWAWEALVNGLPEAAVEDLSLFDSGGLRLLRAAIAARGVWEMAIDTNVTDLTYVRAHDDDLRWRLQALDKQRDGTTPRSWHGSPDVRPRQSPSAPAAFALPTAPLWLPWSRGVVGIDELLRRFQAALRSQKNDPRIRATGKWDLYFEELLREHGAPQGPAPTLTVSVDEPFWKSVMETAHKTAEPWSGVPSEADLYELTPKLSEGTVGAASCEVPRGPVKVDVVVHRRGVPVGGSEIRVTLLHWIDPSTTGRAQYDDSTTWFSGNVPWTAAVNDVLNSNDGTTAQTFAGGWQFSQAAPNSRMDLTGQVVDNGSPGVVTFDADLSAASANDVVLFVALIREGTNVALAAGSLRDLAFNNPGVAIRSVRLVG